MLLGYERSPNVYVAYLEWELWAHFPARKLHCGPCCGCTESETDLDFQPLLLKLIGSPHWHIFISKEPTPQPPACPEVCYFSLQIHSTSWYFYFLEEPKAGLTLPFLGVPTPFQLLSDFFDFSHDGIHLCLLLGPHAELLNCYDKLIFIFCKDSVFWDVCLPFLWVAASAGEATEGAGTWAWVCGGRSARKEARAREWILSGRNKHQHSQQSRFKTRELKRRKKEVPFTVMGFLSLRGLFLGIIRDQTRHGT